MSRIHPIVIYPFQHPQTTQHLNALYLFLDETVRTAGGRYARPLTVVNRQTYHRSSSLPTFQQVYKMVREYSDVHDAWCVDTCQMWLTGFGAAYDSAIAEEESHSDVYWLIPGDFDYASASGQEVLKSFCLIPEKVLKGSDLCIGQLQMHQSSSKHLIDTYGTYGLLFNWFPSEAQQMRAHGIVRPRSEFFAIHHHLLGSALEEHRWFAYEQTIALMLQATGHKLTAVPLGQVVDPSKFRDTLTGALQQIERTERVLKVAWRDRKILNRAKNWVDEFRLLEQKSREIIGAAMTVLENSLERD